MCCVLICVDVVACENERGYWDSESLGTCWCRSKRYHTSLSAFRVMNTSKSMDGIEDEDQVLLVTICNAKLNA